MILAVQQSQLSIVSTIWWEMSVLESRCTGKNPLKCKIVWKYSLSQIFSSTTCTTSWRITTLLIQKLRLTRKFTIRRKLIEIRIIFAATPDSLIKWPIAPLIWIWLLLLLPSNPINFSNGSIHWKFTQDWIISRKLV